MRSVLPIKFLGEIMPQYKLKKKQNKIEQERAKLGKRISRRWEKIKKEVGFVDLHYEEANTREKQAKERYITRRVAK